ncbi:aflatoxin regulatory protein-domain-containing protein [Xylariaceae sp. FL0662B]|nr:aflatoxin regulatory protein-domain-containing protein [Xylariaceae sp. FL0662B]
MLSGDESIPTPTPATSVSMLQDNFSSPISPDLLNITKENNQDIYQTHFSELGELADSDFITSLQTSDESPLGLTNLFKSLHSQDRCSSSTKSGAFVDYQTLPAVTQLCYCLIRALGLLNQLSSRGPTIRTAKGNLDSSEAGTFWHTDTKSITQENEQVLEEIKAILQCHCSQDGYLLVIVSLIVFKVLDRYAAALRATSPTTDDGNNSGNFPIVSPSYYEHVLESPAIMRGCCVRNDNHSRMVAGLILGELHRVQPLVNVLSQRLKVHGRCSSKEQNSTSSPNCTIGNKSNTHGGEGPFTFSSGLLSSFQQDLHRRLHALSAEIMDILKVG